MDLAVSQRSPGHTDPLSKPLDLAGWFIKPVTDLKHQAALVQRRSCGCILIQNGQFVGIRGRWWAYSGNLLQLGWDLTWGGSTQDTLEIYFHQPWSSPQFLTVSYARSGPGTQIATLYCGISVLTEIARIKQSLAIVANITNSRISDRLLERWGWEAHCLDWPGRHFIRRFYGDFPELSTAWQHRVYPNEAPT